MKRKVASSAAKSHSPRPKVSILLPSRNRQPYFKQLILDMISNPRRDLEFVVADNSDDGSIMRAFMETLSDDRIRFLPSLERPLGMRDNFERCVANSRGDWMTMCGDDDYIDPNIPDLLDRALREKPDLDIISWSRIYYRWPDNREKDGKISISLLDFVGEVPKATLLDEYFMWRHRSLTAAVPFTIFHCLVSRKLMDAIRTRFGGRFFGHTTVDVDNFCKILVTANRFMYSARPFSIDGACRQSNQARARGVENYSKLQSEMVKDLGFDPNANGLIRDFPFPSTLGIAASGAQAIEYFKRKHGLMIDGWQENFAKSCEADCSVFSLDQADYEHAVAKYRAAFAAWADGRYARFFDPPAQKPVLETSELLGVVDRSLFVPESIGGVERPKQLYDFVQWILAPIDQLVTVPSLSFVARPEQEQDSPNIPDPSLERRFG